MLHVRGAYNFEGAPKEREQLQMLRLSVRRI